MPDKARELLEEFRAVAGKVGLLDTILPPILFLLLNRLAGFTAAMIGALGLSVLIALLRLRRGQSLLYALAGMGSVGLAIALALLLGRSEGFFLPGIVNGGLTVALALVSLQGEVKHRGIDRCGLASPRRQIEDRRPAAVGELLDEPTLPRERLKPVDRLEERGEVCGYERGVLIHG